MNRRSFLSFLGLAPIAAPAAAVAAQASSQGISVIDLRADGASTFTFDGKTLTLPGVKIRKRVDADAALASRIDTVVEQANAGAFDRVMAKRYGVKAK